VTGIPAILLNEGTLTNLDVIVFLVAQIIENRMKKNVRAEQKRIFYIA